MVEGGLHERSSRSRRALRNTPRSIGRVSLPVNVFCWLGWYEAISATPSAKVATAPCAKRGARRGRGAPSRRRARRYACQPIRPSPTTTLTRSNSPSSSRRYGSQRASSAGVGLLPGGAQRSAAVMYASRRRRPSPRCREVGRLAKPAWWSASKSQSPLRSPVNIRPVRLPPCAAGASRRGAGVRAGRQTPAAAAPSSPRPHTGAVARRRRLHDRRRAADTCDSARSSRSSARELFAIRPDCDTVKAMPLQRDRVPALRVPSVIVHGGAGADPAEGRVELRWSVRAAVLRGWRVLREGGNALDAVEHAVRALEDHPRFHAGRGSVLTSAGPIEMDASIMEGDRLQCGAVAAVSRIANPLTLARRVMEASRHILLVGDGALAFARTQGLPECDPQSLVTERQLVRHHERLAAMQGTVGAVALDTNGTIAAATSTGGLAGKLPGRVGDSALIGCGTYAESSIGGVSCTGDGEAIIRVVLARRALDDLKEADDPEYAARVAVDLLVEEGRGHGGLILLDWRGRMGWAHSTPLMPVALMSPAFAEPRVPF